MIAAFTVLLTPAEEKRDGRVLPFYRHYSSPPYFPLKDFRDQEWGGITVCTINHTTDGLYGEGRMRHPVNP